MCKLDYKERCDWVITVSAVNDSTGAMNRRYATIYAKSVFNTCL